MKERRFRAFTANLVIVAVIATTLGISVSLASPRSATITASAAIYNGNTKGDSVTLMFNVYQNTPEVLTIAKIMNDYGYKTTFFVGGSWANRNGDALIKLATNGFEIGNHGYLHRDHAKLNYEANTAEIKMTERILEATLRDLVVKNSSAISASSNNTAKTSGNICSSETYTSQLKALDIQSTYKATKLFAPPSGSYGGNMFSACKDLGYKVIMWTRDTIDWRDQDANLIYTRAIKNIKAGDLILMHPTPKSVEALPRILDYIMSIGLKVDTVTNTLG